MITCGLCLETMDETKLQKFESNCIFRRYKNINQHLIRYQCLNCDVIFGPQDMLNLPSEKLTEYYQLVYGSGYKEADSSDLEMLLLQYLNPIKNGIYLNFGSGTNPTSEKAKKENIILLNYDPGFPKTGITLDQMKSIKFDGIISNNVLDHMQDPIEILKLMKSLLKSNASMIHASDGFDYNIPYTKAHLYFFVGKSVEYITKNIGMAYEEIPYDINPEIKIVKWTN